MKYQSEVSGGNANGGARSSRRKFIVTECIVASLIGLLVILMVVPAFQKVDEVGPWNASGWHLFEIGNAMHAYVDDHKTLPPAVVYDMHGRPLYSWRVLLLPYLKEQALYSQFKLDEPWDSPNNKPLLARIPNVYVTPSQYEHKQQYATHYQVFTGGGALFEASLAARLLSFKEINAADGMSRTLMVVEAAEPVFWSKPEDLPYSPDQPLPKLGSLFIKKGFHVMMADGSTRWFTADIDEKTLRAMITWNGGEQFTFPD